MNDLKRVQEMLLDRQSGDVVLGDRMLLTYEGADLNHENTRCHWLLKAIALDIRLH